MYWGEKVVWWYIVYLKSRHYVDTSMSGGGKENDGWPSFEKYNVHDR